MKKIYRALISLSLLGLVGCAGNQNVSDRNQNLAGLGTIGILKVKL